MPLMSKILILSSPLRNHKIHMLKARRYRQQCRTSLLVSATTVLLLGWEMLVVVLKIHLLLVVSKTGDKYISRPYERMTKSEH